MVATGIPEGICKIDRMLSQPSIELDDLIGTPITGNRRMGGYHAGQVGRSAGSGDNRPDTSPVSVLGEIGDHFGHPVRRPRR